MNKIAFTLLSLGLLAVAAGFSQVPVAQAQTTCFTQPVSLNAEPLQVEKDVDPINFSYQATTDCADRSQIKFIVRASPNHFQNDYKTVRSITIPTSAFRQSPGTNFYIANGTFSYALFQFETNTSLEIRGCTQYKSEAIACEDSGFTVSVKQDPPPGGGDTGGDTGGGTGGGIGATQDYDKIIGSFENPLKANSIPELLVRLMRILLGLVAAVAVVVIIISGFRMVLSQGNQMALTKAKAAITWAVIGLIVSLMAFSIIAILQRLIETN
jgi:hypothetical protein